MIIFSQRWDRPSSYTYGSVSEIQLRYDFVVCFDPFNFLYWWSLWRRDWVNLGRRQIFLCNMEGFAQDHVDNNQRRSYWKNNVLRNLLHDDLLCLVEIDAVVWISSRRKARFAILGGTFRCRISSKLLDCVGYSRLSESLSKYQFRWGVKGPRFVTGYVLRHEFLMTSIWSERLCCQVRPLVAN